MSGSTRSMSATQIQRFIRICVDQGIKVTRTKKGLLLRFPDGTSTTQHFTNSDVRAQQNQIARFRRAGMTHPDDTRANKDLPAYITSGSITDKTRQKIIDFIASEGYPESVLSSAVVRKLNMDPGWANRALFHSGFRPGAPKSKKIGRPWYTPDDILALKDAPPTTAEPIEVPDSGLDVETQESESHDDAFSPEVVEAVGVVTDAGWTASIEVPAPESIEFDPPLTEQESTAYEEAMSPVSRETEPEVHVENGREYIDTVDSWAVDMRTLLGEHLNRMVEDRLGVLTAVGIEYEIRVWRKK